MLWYVYKLRKVCIKSNGHSVTSVLIICLRQLTTNMELTPKLCGQELRLPIAIAIWILILIEMALPCKRNSRSGSRSGSTYQDRNPENFVPCKRSVSASLVNFGKIFVSQSWNSIFTLQICSKLHIIRDICSQYARFQMLKYESKRNFSFCLASETSTIASYFKGDW